MNILHIDSSILGEHSVSRTISAEIVARQLALHPDAKVVRRDLAADESLHLSSAHLAAFQGGSVTDASLSADLVAGGTYIDDLFSADVIVIGAPMYNLSIPSQLKAWIDRVVVAGRTFQYGATGPEGLVPREKKVFVASSRGGVYSGESPWAGRDHHERYLLDILAFIGLSDVTIIRAEGVAVGEDFKAKAIAQARAEVALIAA